MEFSITVTKRDSAAPEFAEAISGFTSFKILSYE
jgi:hypothetical protein